MFSLRVRAAARPLSSRFLSSTTRLRNEEPVPKPPQPPKPIDDSTSALDYKQAHRTRPPPLPTMDLPRSRSAEEAVTNILYNTPPPSLQPFKKHVLNCLVQNEPGVLSRVSGILAGRGFNIDSLVVCKTEIRDLSRMCIVLSGQDGVVEQARRQLEDLVPVWVVLDYTNTRTISRELLLVKVSILGPEYLEEQLKGGPTHEPRRISPTSKLEREAEPPKIVDVSEHTVIIELTAKTARVEAFLNLIKPFGILEAARTGLMAMPRTPIASSGEDEETWVEGVTVDAHLLPSRLNSLYKSTTVTRVI
ncbi:hypothetical protein FB45DRAFT_893626 [Roridomyces roridus]|uniref:ACT domain-containing protein n=1 Tax=Roridomyces roridus TaxID=1738132 RepID=A0AAD7G0N2_9AGAR|nr:hypothetical protein FB45DRAFT_893626 [Roridomyces roridus]